MNLMINGEMWAFLSYETGHLRAYKDKRVATFKLPKKTFEAIASQAQSSGLGINQEVAILSEKEEAILKKLAFGKKFLGKDGHFYYLEKIKNRVLDIYNENGDFQCPIFLVDKVFDEFDKKAFLRRTPIQKKKDFESMSLKEKVETGIASFYSYFHNTGNTSTVLLEIGNIIEGVAYNHETNRFYKLIGLQVYHQISYHFENTSETEKQVGFYPIFIGKAKNYDPIHFHESGGPRNEEDLFFTSRYFNGFGDHLELSQVLIKKEDIKKELDIGQYFL